MHTNILHPNRIRFTLLALCSLFLLAAGDTPKDYAKIGDWNISDLARLMEDRGTHLYWLEFDLDGEKLDSDYFWNGKSDLYFKIMTQGNPNPIYSTSFSKNFEGGKITAPFASKFIDVGKTITITILDDDSGGRVLELLLSTTTNIRRFNSTKIQSPESVSIPTPSGLIVNLGLPNASHESQIETTNVVEYPQWLIQNEASEIVADPIHLTVPESGMSSAILKVS